MTDVSGARAKVELGEGVHATCRLSAEAPREEENFKQDNVDLSSLSSMLQARWKGGQGGGGPKGEGPRSGQIRSFRISKLDAATKKIELELV
jgi:small subunit ribosomal protein S1